MAIEDTPDDRDISRSSWLESAGNVDFIFLVQEDDENEEGQSEDDSDAVESDEVDDDSEISSSENETHGENNDDIVEAVTLDPVVIGDYSEAVNSSQTDDANILTLAESHVDLVEESQSVSPVNSENVNAVKESPPEMDCNMDDDDSGFQGSSKSSSPEGSDETSNGESVDTFGVDPTEGCSDFNALENDSCFSGSEDGDSIDSSDDSSMDSFEGDNSSRDSSSDESLDIFEEEARLTESCNNMSDEPYTGSYEGAMERNRARFRHQVATGEWIPGVSDSELRRRDSPSFPLYLEAERKRRDAHGLQGAKRLLKIAKVLMSYFKNGQENLLEGQKVLKLLSNYGYSPQMVVYAVPLVDMIMRLTFHSNRIVRRLAKKCYIRFRPLFIIPPDKTFLEVLEEEVRNKNLPWNIKPFNRRRRTTT